MGTYKCTDPGPVLWNMAVGRVAILYYRQIRIARARTCIAKLASKEGRKKERKESRKKESNVMLHYGGSPAYTIGNTILKF